MQHATAYNSLNDSPRKSPTTHPEAREEENTAQARTMHTRSAENHTRECTVDDFYATYITPKGWKRVNNTSMRGIISKLTEGGHINEDGQWRDLLTDEKFHGENAHFGRLAKVVEAVVEAASSQMPRRFAKNKRTCLFNSRPDNETLSEVEGSSFHVDAFNHFAKSTYTSDSSSGSAQYTTLGSGSGNTCNINTADVTFSYEFKLQKDDKKVLDDDMKTIGAAGHYLFADLRRASHFALTSEGKWARLWNHSRSHSAVTLFFDIHKNKEELIQGILFSSFADEFQLGFDPTVVRVLDSKKYWQYQFDVCHNDGTTHTYQTTEILHENCAAALYTRAMRVFKVRRVSERGDGLSLLDCDDNVLRDYWLWDDDDTLLEREIQNSLRAKFKEAAASDEEFEEIWKHFLHIEADGVVAWNGYRDAVPAPPAASTPYKFADPLNPKGSKSSKARVEGSTPRQEAGYIGPARPAQLESAPLQLHGRKHCRTLYTEVCVDLYKVDDPALFFFALEESVFTISWLRRVDSMHRDMSPGNTMLWQLAAADESNSPSKKPLCERYVTKMADLEYLKDYDKISMHDPITGTGDYMAIEVSHRMHLFYDSGLSGLLARRYFSYNFLHDLESILWMALDFVMHRMPRDRLLDKATWATCREHAVCMVSHANRLFVNTTEPVSARELLIKDVEASEELKETLASVYGLESPLVALADLLPTLRRTYKTVEDSTIVPHGSTRNAPQVTERMAASLFHANAKIYDDARKVFRDIITHYTPSEGLQPLVLLSQVDLQTGELLISEPAEGSKDQPMHDISPTATAHQEPPASAESECTTRKRKSADAARAKPAKRARTTPAPAPQKAPRKAAPHKQPATEHVILRRSKRLQASAESNAGGQQQGTTKSTKGSGSKKR
ncbi:hypothetical protein BD626DRAFT_397737 [Schizophyllum amplum]|uniref:Fungal-type protein kinase domain-containing protein n=1 Tax=Schizophyllum amplum TaxID=97359 RepID=A0A550CLP5_9AGAR|nr:hypothetical protein BD626DRAFT_397737 [Auriculariopsis ampla]